jgi:hypothetical protein
VGRPSKKTNGHGSLVRKFRLLSIDCQRIPLIAPLDALVMLYRFERLWL